MDKPIYRIIEEQFWVELGATGVRGRAIMEEHRERAITELAL